MAARVKSRSHRIGGDVNDAAEMCGQVLDRPKAFEEQTRSSDPLEYDADQARELVLTAAELRFIDYLVDEAIRAWMHD